jgi:hypothetical protein
MTTTAINDPMMMERGATLAHPGVIGGALAITGALVMIAGAAFHFASGADLESALIDGTMAGYLTDAAEHSTALWASLSLWIVGATAMGVGGVMLASLGHGPAAIAGRTVYTYGAALAATCFIVGMALIRLADGGSTNVELADALGFIAWHIDSIATVALVGAGPLLVALAGRGGWAPRWLLIWGALAAIAGAISLVGLYVSDLTTVGLLVVPIGIGWMIAAGLVAIRGQQGEGM